MSAVPSLAGRSLFEWITLGCRLVLGGVLAVSGALKVPHLDESVLSVRLYQIPGLFPFTELIGTVQPILELAVGLLLIVGLFTRWSALLGALAMVVFICGIASVWARGIAIDCGCFGGGKEVALEEALRNYPWDIARDVGLLICGAWAVWRPKSPFAVDGWLFAPVADTEEIQPDEPDQGAPR